MITILSPSNSRDGEAGVDNIKIDENSKILVRLENVLDFYLDPELGVNFVGFNDERSSLNFGDEERNKAFIGQLEKLRVEYEKGLEVNTDLSEGRLTRHDFFKIDFNTMMSIYVPKSEIDEDEATPSLSYIPPGCKMDFRFNYVRNLSWSEEEGIVLESYTNERTAFKTGIDHLDMETYNKLDVGLARYQSGQVLLN